MVWRKMLSALPSGRRPDGTGESPVLPEAHRRRRKTLTNTGEGE